MSKITKIENVNELAMMFFDRMLDNNEDYIEPDSKSGQLMSAINDIIYSNLEFKLGSELESKIMEMSYVDCEMYYCWGFEKALEVARVIYGSETVLDQLKKL